jgi:branched-chain amino acid transport system substrate-binding protein
MLIALAIQHMGELNREGMPEALRAVANAPGEEVGPGDWARAVELLAAGEDINYQGASGPIEFDEAGNVPGLVAEFLIEDGTFVQGEILTLGE